MTEENKKRNVSPEEVETTETLPASSKEETETGDASQVDSKRKDSPESVKYDDPSEEGDAEQGPELDEYPQLTGEEENVTQDEGSHHYQEKVNEGPVNGEESEEDK